MQCPNGYKCVPGNGPKPCRIMCIGEAPGKVEVARGIPLCGPTGQEFNNTYLPLAGLMRSEVYATNTVKHTNTVNKKPTIEDVHKCSECSLRLEFNEVQPEIVVLMGATACSLLDGSEWEIDLEVQHGRPFEGELYGNRYWFVPMWHPALGLHKTSAMTELLDDWAGLEEWLKDGEYRWAVDWRGKDYRLLDNMTLLEEYTTNTIAFSNPPWPLMGIDTETHGRDNYSIQFSLLPGSALMLRLEDRELLRFAVDWINHAIREGMQLVFHNAPADIPMVMGLGINGFLWRDTMQEAYHFARLPQGLKALSYRLLGCKRKSWAETVTPPSLEVLGQWIVDGIGFAQRNWTVVEERRGKRGQLLKPKLTKSKAERVLMRIMNHMWNATYNPWERIEEDLMPLLGDEYSRVAALGPVPVKGIAYCSLEDQIQYACSDADDTLTLALLFDEMRKLVGNDIMEDDDDYHE